MTITIMRKQLLITCALAAALCGGPALAALNIPSDGSDGDLIITNNTVIDLSQAITGKWDTNNSANAGKGVYDPEKWAVVFKYSSVVVSGGCTVYFKNHASRAPVVWLVQSNVTVNGAVSLNGQDWVYAPALSEPGPGGFRGGSGVIGGTYLRGAGFGVGGGGVTPSEGGGGGSFGSWGVYDARPPYGNPSLIPLIGGSGGGGIHWANPTGGGGSGGGAILIGSGSVISLSGTINANGGQGARFGDGNNMIGSGSGGAIRLIAGDIQGNGRTSALGGSQGFSGGVGRIRIERVAYSGNIQVTPDPSVVTLTDSTTPQIWMPDNGPTVKIVSIGGTNSPTDPRSSFGAAGADVVLPQVSTTAVIVETTNVEEASVVKVRVTPRANGNYTETTAGSHVVINPDPLVIRWTVNVPVNNGYSAMQVKVTRP